jgi:glyoxylase-like metal-dependent hydrolase (beta-lactamase superfamily II)
MIEITRFIVGPLENNVYLLSDSQSKAAAIVDPAFEGQEVIDEIKKRGLILQAIWITHAHFDHIAGINTVLQKYSGKVTLLVNQLDLEAWRIPTWAAELGIPVEDLPAPDEYLHHGQILKLGEDRVEVRHAPGHSQGHVMFYIPAAKALICGDVIFKSSIGRTDLAGGDYATLIESIKNQVLTLPEDTRLLPGHGPETSVGRERVTNPFL